MEGERASIHTCSCCLSLAQTGEAGLSVHLPSCQHTPPEEVGKKKAFAGKCFHPEGDAK